MIDSRHKNDGIVLRKLMDYCEAEDFAGWDPYDGLNSRVFRALPFVGRSAFARLAWIQLFKRNPYNLRRLLLIPKQRNAKGIGLFVRGYCALWRALDKQPSLSGRFGDKERIMNNIVRLSDWLVDNPAKGVSGAAWGYNFPWQCRLEFLFPAGEPTVVATYFCASALFDAYEITGDRRYLDTALSAADFVKNDLRRTSYSDGLILSYSRMPGNDTIFNASLLGSALLARCYSYSHDEGSLELARLSVNACCHAQKSDGSWTYGLKSVTGWIDSFHTGYNLMAIEEYMRYSGDFSPKDNLERGLNYYLANFFMDGGSPKYYHDRKFPIDIHCVGQLAVTLISLGVIDRYRPLVDKVIDWAYANMWNDRGYFYYQLKQGVSSKISYMRWSNAFMFASLAALAGHDASAERNTNLKEQLH